jgi:hypothetical protein
MLKLNKKWRTFIWVFAALALMLATIPLAIWLTHTQTAEFGNARARCNKGLHDTHRVIVKDDTVDPTTTYASKCDTLVITNLDANQRLMAFGKHDNHISYDGVSEQLLNQGQSLTVHLIKSGSYIFHDHSDQMVRGSFVVSQ